MFPAGTTVIDEPIQFIGQIGLKVRGLRQTKLVYRGPSTRGVIQFVGCRESSLQGVDIVIDRPNVDVDAAVCVTNAPSPSANGYSTNNLIEDVKVLTEGPHAPKWAFNVDSFAAGGTDGNNDHHKFFNCTAKCYSEAGFRVNGGQCHDLYYFACTAADYGGRKPIGFHVPKGIFFTWHKGSMNSNSLDFKLESAEHQCVIDGHNTENSERFLVYQHQSGMLNLSVRDVRWEGKPMAQHVVDVAGAGPSRVENAFFSGLNGNCPTMYFRGLRGSVDLAGVTIRQYGGATPGTPLISVPNLTFRNHGLFLHRILPNSRTFEPIVVNIPQP